MFKFSSFRFVLLASWIFLTIQNASAQSVSAEGDYSKIKHIFSSLEAGRAASYASDQLDFVFQGDQFGVLKISFVESPKQARSASFANGDSETKDSSEVLLLKGEGYLNGLSLPVAGSVYRVDGKEELHIHFISPSTDPSLPSGTAHEIIQALDDGSSPVLKTAAAETYAGKKCGTEQVAVSSALHQEGASPVKAPAVNSLVAMKVIDLATEADFDYYAKYGASSNSRIASIVNAAQVIYERDLSLRFNIVRQRVNTTSAQPYTSTDSGVLLDQLGDVVVNGGGLQGADLVHLFTGKDIDDSVVGLAWVGVTCTSQAYYATSLTQDLDPTLDFIIFAHEVGHNLGAPHDENLPRSVMYPSVGDDQTAFSAASKTAIATHLAAGGNACFASIDAPAPTPTPTPEPTPDPRGGGDTGDGTGDGGNSEEPYLDFWATFNARTGTANIEIVRNYFYEGQCLAKIRVGGKANLSDAQKFEVRSDSDYLHFIAKTTKRLSDSRTKIYLRAELSECDGGEPTIKSEVLSFKPSSARSTRKSDKVTVKAWNQDIVRKMKYRNY